MRKLPAKVVPIDRSDSMPEPPSPGNPGGAQSLGRRGLFAGLLLLKQSRERLYSDWLRGRTPRSLAKAAGGLTVPLVDANLRAEALDREERRRELERAARAWRAA